MNTGKHLTGYTAFVLFLVAGVAVPTLAQEIPQRKAGWWQMAWRGACPAEHQPDTIWMR